MEYILTMHLCSISSLVRLALVFFATLQPYSPVVETHVALVEENTVYDAGNNSVLFKQFVFWDEDGRVVAWRFIKREGLYFSNSLFLLDGDVIRQVHFVSRFRSGSFYDVEMADRELTPCSERRELGSRP